MSSLARRGSSNKCACRRPSPFPPLLSTAADNFHRCVALREAKFPARGNFEGLSRVLAIFYRLGSAAIDDPFIESPPNNSLAVYITLLGGTIIPPIRLLHGLTGSKQPSKDKEIK